MRNILALLILGTAPLAASTILNNGDFEDPNIGNVNYYLTLNAGSTFLTGWTVDAPSPGAGIDIVSNRAPGCNSCVNTGQQAVDLSGTPGPGAIYQDLPTFGGATYLLSFWVSSNIGPWPDGMTIAWGGSNIDTISTPAQGTWQNRQYTLTASGDTTRLEFISNVSGNAGPFLDTVSVDLVSGPEPGSAVLMLLSLVAVPLLRRVVR
jgi:choice-of-anchor C domain-containing protein